MIIKGVVVSSGYAYGNAFLLSEENIHINKNNINASDINFEISNFLKAHKKTIKQFKKIQSNLLDEDKKLLFDGYIILLEDKNFINDIILLIKNDLISAEFSIDKIIKKQINVISKVNNSYIKERVNDFLDIGKRLICNLKNIDMFDYNFLNNKENIIIISKDISPSQIIQFNLNKIVGFITELGSLNSHTSIIAKSLELPGLIKVKNITKLIYNNDYIIIDGIKNNIYINPDKNIIDKFKNKNKIYLYKKKQLIKLSKLDTETLDGYKIKLFANIGSDKDISNILDNGAEGIGLYRTEFLFMNRNSFPSEDEQFFSYKKIIEFMNGKIVTIRTLDLGGDKFLPYMNFPKEETPFLGLRSIRIYVNNKNILRNQLKAILRASIYGKVRIMFPMIISLEEVSFLKKEFNKVKYELKNKKINFDNNIKIGAMIETPAAVMISKYLADELDFFSIGTNDLTQYTLAVDRNNSMVSYLYETLSPSVLRLIKYSIDAVHKKNKKIGICGELAADDKVTMLLLGLGLDELSMSSNFIPKIKNNIRNFLWLDSKKLAFDILKVNKVKKVKYLLKKSNLKNKKKIL